MPGTNAGTGQPIWFKCHKYRLASNAAFYSRTSHELSMRHRVTLTGRRRKRYGRRGQRMTSVFREYTCACGYIGWSAHVDLERMEAKGAT